MPLIKPRHHVWTEAEVLALAGESDHFDRKSGKLLEDKETRQKLSKAVGAFANSGGGHIFLGVADNGTFDGVELKHGRQPIREYVETLVTSCTSYPVSSVNVNDVVPDPTSSKIPEGARFYPSVSATANGHRTNPSITSTITVRAVDPSQRHTRCLT